MNSRLFILFVALFVVGVVIVLWIIPFFTKPIGVPSDFYEISDRLNDSDMDIYYIGDNIPLNERVKYNKITDLTQVPKTISKSTIIIDYGEIGYSINYDLLEDLYQDYCYYVVLINYNTNDLNHLIETGDETEEIIILDYDTCGGNYTSSTIDLPDKYDQQTVQYILTDLLEKKVN